MSLVHYWPMEEVGGAIVADTVGALGDGAILYDPGDVSSFETGTIFGRARNFQDPDVDADSSMLRLYTGTPDATYAIPVWSVSFRIMRDGAASGFSDVFYQGVLNQSGLITLGINTSGSYLYFECQDDIGSEWDEYTIPATGTVWDGFWHRITITSNGTTVRVYLDGAEVMSIASAVELKPKAPCYLGGSRSEADPEVHFSSGFFSADDLGFYDESLAPSFISSSDYLSFPLSYEGPSWPSETDIAAGSQFSYLDIDDGVLDPIRIPISSWQATLQADRSTFVQAVVPAVLDWVDAITARLTAGQIIITQAARFASGTEQEYEAARVPLQQFRVSRGPNRATAVLSGYSTIAAASASAVRVLRNVRSYDSSGGSRYRCDIDPTVRPGNTAQVGADTFVVAYINIYVNDSDRYMDVGERAL